MSLSKKKREAIERLSFGIEVLAILYRRRIAGEPWWDTNPEMWDTDEREAWDVVFDAEEKLKDAVLQIIDPKKED